MINYDNQPPQNDALPNNDNKMSVYSPSTDSLGDFPVLKAFQQYINEEQAKAQKRMMMMCGVFIIILVLVVSVFTILLVNANRENAGLNGRLFEIATRPPAVDTRANGQNAESIKVLTDSLTQMQTQMTAQQAKLVKEQQELFEEKLKMLTKPVEKPDTPSPAQIATENKLKAMEERLQRMTNQIKKDKEELAQQKEGVRRLKVELERRQLYPEYYGLEDENPPSKSVRAAKKTPSKKASAAVKEPLTEEDTPTEGAEAPSKKSDLSGYINYFDQYEDDEDAPAPKKAQPKKAVKKTAEAPLPAYDNLSVGSGSSDSLDWQIPLD